MNKRKIIALGSILLLPIILLVGLFLTTKQTADLETKQEVRKKAAEPTGNATFILNPSTKAVWRSATTVNLPVEVKFRTPTTPDNKGIVGIKLVASYNNASGWQLTDANVQTPLASPWNYARKEVVTVGSTTTITIEAIYFQAGEFGYLGAVANDQIFAVLSLAAQDNGQTTTISNFTFDTSKSEIRSKSGNQDILSSSLGSGSYTVYVDKNAPDTTINTKPAVIINTSIANFTFSGTDTPNPPTGTEVADLVYSYKFDTGDWSNFDAVTMATFNNLTEGDHTFQVKAKDKVGNVDITSASYTFRYEGRTNLNIKIKFQGLTSTSQNYAKTVAVKIRKTGYDSGNLNMAFQHEANGNYNGVASLPADFPAGTNAYEALVKGPSHLQKKWATVNIVKNTDNTFTKIADADVLVVGDVTDDNYIKINDVTAVIGVWTSTETPVTVALQKYDLNEDGKIAMSDITAIISNWTVSERKGDE